MDIKEKKREETLGLVGLCLHLAFGEESVCL